MPADRKTGWLRFVEGLAKHLFCFFNELEGTKCGLAIVVTLDNVRRAKVSIFSGCNSHPATVVPAGSNRDDRGGNEPVEALDGKGRFGRLREWAGRNMRERRAGLEKRLTVGADPTLSRGRPPSWT
jgi:hypothetical protein